VAVAAGWYPDPLGLWDVRWWDGAEWRDAVRSGSHQDTDPVAPIADLVAVTPAAGVVWQSRRVADAVNTERYVLTGRTLSVYNDLSRPPTKEWQLWTIGRAEPRVTGGPSLMGVGGGGLRARRERRDARFSIDSLAASVVHDHDRASSDLP
jgi:hypothetical protein